MRLGTLLSLIYILTSVKLFGLNLACVFTKSGNYNGIKSDDDISDAILVYASTRDKYKIKRFGRISPKERG